MRPVSPTSNAMGAFRRVAEFGISSATKEAVTAFRSGIRNDEEIKGAIGANQPSERTL